jgi:uncharacterized caspase-like protein
MKPWSKTVHFYQVILVFWLMAAAASPAVAAKKVALVIGNSNYASSPLANPVNDAADMDRVLKQLGFSVILKTDAGRRDMMDALNEFGRSLVRSEIGIFYFAGHGMQIDNTNYLIPVDARVESESDVIYEGVEAGRILGKMKDAGNRLNIVILDACRNNPFARSFRASSQGLAKMDAPPGSILAYATSPGSLAEDGSGRNGVYTGSLLKNLIDPGLTVQELFNQTGLDVMNQTAQKQVPWISSTPVPRFFLAGSAPGDQGLRPAPSQPEAQSAQSVPQPKATPQSNAGSYEIVFWESIKDSANADAFKAYLEQYPDGAFAPLARIKLQQSAPEKDKTDFHQPVSKENVNIQLASIDPKEKDPDIVAKDGHYIKYKNGIVYDSKTGLEWVASSQGNLNDGFAKRWVSRLTIGGGGWRMPSEDELKSLYQKGAGTRNMTRLIEAKAWHFFSRDSKTWHWKGFDFQSFRPFVKRYDDDPTASTSNSYKGVAFSALAVRPRR